MWSACRRFPRQIKFIVGNEACERFSFYGMRSILTVFMVQRLLIPAPESEATYHLFVGASYLFPILGGYLSDRFLGKYRTILYLSLVYCLGHAVLALWEGKAALYWGLGLIALGSGGIKPCVSAHVGDQFTEGDRELVRKVFDIFYWAINFGSFFSTLLIPWVLPRYGPAPAFGIPGILMAIATFVFWLGRDFYVHVPPTGKTGASGFMPVFLYSLRHWPRKGREAGFFDVARARFTQEEVEAAEAAAGVFKVFVTVSIFWSLYDQYGSSLVLQAQSMDRRVLGVTLESSQISAVNPVLIMLLIPAFSGWIYPRIEALGVSLTALRKMSAGMVLAAVSFVFVGFTQAALDGGRRLSVSWQFVPYLILTVSEILISITGLEFAYSQAPRSMKSTLMSFWFLTIFAGNLITAYVLEINIFRGAGYFFFFAALMAAVSVVFIFNASRYRTRSYFEKKIQPATT